MIPPFRRNGTLPPGIHWTTWEEFVQRFGGNPHRQALRVGLRAALDNLRQAGCQEVYLDGSFATDKAEPQDFDGCWSKVGVDPGSSILCCWISVRIALRRKRSTAARCSSRRLRRASSTSFRASSSVTAETSARDYRHQAGGIKLSEEL